MATRSFQVTSATLMSVAFLSACTSSPGTDIILALPESVQRQAHMACQAEQGINIPEAINVLRLNDGRVLVSVVNGPGLSLSQARGINQCASAKLLNEHASTLPAQEPAPTTPTPQQPAPAIQTAPETYIGLTSVPGCRPGGGILQGGTSTCPGY